MDRNRRFCSGQHTTAGLAFVLSLLISTLAFTAQDELIFIEGFESGESCIWSETVTPEVCDFLDNDCNGLIDDGDFADPFEPNDSCGEFTSLAGVGSNQTLIYSTQTLFPGGDEDFFRFLAQETDSSCGCCDPPFCFDEDYRLLVNLAVPFGAGTYELCVHHGSCEFPAGWCTTVGEGQQDGLSVVLDGSCAETDAYDIFVRVRAIGSPGFSCAPYELTYTFISGICG